MNYSILEEEKRNISKLLNQETLGRVNFVIDTLENNIKEATNYEIGRAHV